MWHLKNNRLEKALEKLDSKFVEKLQEYAAYSEEAYVVRFGEVQSIGCINEPKFSMIFSKDEIVQTSEYNDHGWNTFPGTIPPVNIPMRVDAYSKDGKLLHSCRGHWTGDRWLTWNGYELNDCEYFKYSLWDDLSSEVASHLIVNNDKDSISLKRKQVKDGKYHISIDHNGSEIMLTPNDARRLSNDLSLLAFDCSVRNDDRVWHEFPKIKPPYDVNLQVQMSNGKRLIAYYHKFEDGECWCHKDGTVMPEAISSDIQQFRNIK